MQETGGGWLFLRGFLDGAFVVAGIGLPLEVVFSELFFGSRCAIVPDFRPCLGAIVVGILVVCRRGKAGRRRPSLTGAGSLKGSTGPRIGVGRKQELAQEASIGFGHP